MRSGGALSISVNSVPTAPRPIVPLHTIHPSPFSPAASPRPRSPSGVPSVAVDLDGNTTHATRGTPHLPSCAKVDVYAERDARGDSETPTLSLRLRGFLPPRLSPKETSSRIPASRAVRSLAIVLSDLGGSNYSRSIAEHISSGPLLLFLVVPGPGRSSSGVLHVFFLILMPPVGILLGLVSSASSLASLLPPISNGACAEAELQATCPM